MRYIEPLARSLKWLEGRLIAYSFLVILVLFAVSSLLLIKHRYFFLSKSDAVSSWVLFVTFVAIVWYTLETIKLRKATEGAVELENKPILSLNAYDFTQFNEDAIAIEVVNIGKGAALNVSCSIMDPFDPREWVQQIGHLAAGGAAKVKRDTMFDTYLFKNQAGTAEFVVCFSDAGNKKYESKYRFVAPSRFEPVEPQK
jgi:hypothetical protein